jgi:tetratricopeptide (TPR) repeat protein
MNPPAHPLPKPPRRVWLAKWLNTRNYLRLTAGVPALLAGAALVAYGVFQFGWTPAHAAGVCRELAGRAFLSRDYETARLACQSLLQMSGQANQEYAFLLLQCARELGRKDEAMRLTRWLAPLDKPGFAPAHLYVAQQLLAATNLTAEAMSLVERHLQAAVSAQPDNLDALELLTKVYMQTGRWEQAKRHLLELVASKSEAMLPLAIVLQSEGDEAGARSWAERSAKYFRERMGKATADDPGAYIGLANCKMLLKDYAGAAALLEGAAKQWSTPAYKQALGRVCANWARHLAADSPGDVFGRLAVVQRGLDQAPAYDVLLSELNTLTSLEEKEAAPLTEKLRRLLAEGTNPGFQHLCLGNLAWRRGQLEEARQHFKLAQESGPVMTVLENNLAMILTFQERPDLPRALGLIEQVLARSPDQAEYRASRGQIFLRMGRFEEALADLESALPRVRDGRMTRAGLAQVYRALGKPDRAAEFEGPVRSGSAVPDAPEATATNAPPAGAASPK